MRREDDTQRPSVSPGRPKRRLDMPPVGGRPDLAELAELTELAELVATRPGALESLQIIRGTAVTEDQVDLPSVVQGLPHATEHPYVDLLRSLPSHVQAGVYGVWVFCCMGAMLLVPLLVEPTSTAA